MKILHSAPLDIEISPRLKYAGTERILLYLNKGLSLAGHNSVVGLQEIQIWEVMERFYQREKNIYGP